MTKIMAIDYGTKRVGIASTDESGLFAIPRMVLPNDLELMEKIIKFQEEYGISKIIIGESRNFQGEENLIQQEIEKFKTDLEKFLSLGSKNVDVLLHPEILTTREARQIQGNTELTDASAAALILKSYIDSEVKN